MPWWFAVAERDHELQNPTTADKIRLLGERLRLAPTSRVLDVACGKGGPAVVLAATFGCRIVGVEKSAEFVAAARERVAAAGLTDRIEIVESDARAFALEPERWDVVLCLGATFIWDGLGGTLDALAPTVRPDGYLVVGEPYWRRWPLPASVEDDGFVGLPETVDRFARAGLPVVTLIAASEDDWDRYETLHWRAVEEWLVEHQDEPETTEIRRQHEAARDRYLSVERDLLGWAIFVGWKQTTTAAG